ncbi:MAG: metallopeptidase family protein [Candidatus Omnitrophica bacterium]|nr:metallopeptidase family protein [Candidatus Omnitrophota bacterium]
MDHQEFESLATKAVQELPDDFKNKLENVDIIIEERPINDRLLGLYEGVPLMRRTHYYGMILPDRITLFKHSIERVCGERGIDVYEEIKHVLQHEIAHHFGISDERLRDLGTY